MLFLNNRCFIIPKSYEGRLKEIMGYRYDIRQLTPQQQGIINQRDLNNSLHNKSVSSTKLKEIYPL